MSNKRPCTFVFRIGPKKGTRCNKLTNSPDQICSSCRPTALGKRKKRPSEKTNEEPVSRKKAKTDNTPPEFSRDVFNIKKQGAARIQELQDHLTRCEDDLKELAEKHEEEVQKIEDEITLTKIQIKNEEDLLHANVTATVTEKRLNKARKSRSRSPTPEREQEGIFTKIGNKLFGVSKK